MAPEELTWRYEARVDEKGAGPRPGPLCVMYPRDRALQ